MTKTDSLAEIRLMKQQPKISRSDTNGYKQQDFALIQVNTYFYLKVLGCAKDV